MKDGTQIGKRVVVIGTSGSGKTTMAEALAQKLGIQHVELDALHWEPNWIEAQLEVFRQRTADALAGDSWVVDGNYSKVRDLVWARATTVVWLDYHLSIIMTRLLVRTFSRILSRKELWNGNREELHTQLFTKDSIFLWTLASHPKYKVEYPNLLAMPEHSHLALVRLHNPKHADEWLKQVALVPE